MNSTLDQQAIHEKPPHSLPANNKKPQVMPAAHSYLLNHVITHHPKSGLNPIADASSHLFTLIGKLRQFDSWPDLLQLHSELSEEMNTFYETIKNHGYSTEYSAVCRYVMCASLDEIISHTPFGSKGKWNTYSLLAAFNQDLQHEEKFFAILERIIKEPALYIDLMELMYLSLSMEYKGRYRSAEHGQYQLEQITNSLYKHIRAYRGSFSKVLSPTPFKVSKDIMAASRQKNSLKSIFIVTVCVILTILMSLSYLLDVISNEPYKTFPKQRSKLDSLIKRTGIIRKPLLHLAMAGIAALLIWYLGPYLVYDQYAPFAETERRLYVILLILLAWCLKFLMIDLNIPHPFQYKNPKLRKKIFTLQHNLLGAIKFLDKTAIPGHPKKMKMSELPCYLLMGGENAGKTTLLKNAGIHFILQKQTQKEGSQAPAASKQCDWWVMREASMIDLPGKYLSSSNGIEMIHNEEHTYSILWMFFLRMMKKMRGKKAINGIIIALPAPEIMNHQHDNKHYHALIRDLFQRIQDVQKMFAHPVVCQLVITKCDLLPGFTEFFAETSTEEAIQPLGITLPLPREGENVADLFTARFNALIKNINQQLLWRLHQERNPMTRPAIKDFPLQVERIKEFTADFIKKLSIIRLNISLRGVYLMSACQHPEIAENNIDAENIDTTTKVIQIFREPVAASRAYFVKQFFTLGLNQTNDLYKKSLNLQRIKIRLAYAASAGCIILAAVILGKDFQLGIKQTTTISHHLADYQHKIAHA